MARELDLLEEFGTLTFSDVDPKHKALGLNRKAKKDPRNWRMENFRRVGMRTAGRQLWSNPIQLDQGAEGACVGFGWTGKLNSAPRIHEFNNLYAHGLYKQAQSLDPWAGDSYEGTTVLAGAKAVRSRGFIQAYAFSANVETIAQFVLNYGPVVIGVDWFTGMDRVDSNGFIHVKGEERGGHCVVIDGVTWNYRNVEPNRFRFRNSWGKSWGFNGRGRISATDLQTLLSRNGDACTSVEV